jgi:hypothetical protein
MSGGEVLVIEGLMNWLTAFSVQFGPRALVRRLGRRLHHTS